ncbi:sulfatase [Hirschia litorea]|uniref:Sulfatase n=1 Tax=Hirschia litorea TaxID=1199156 RepID=A0ABW2IP86_9PROT
MLNDKLAGTLKSLIAASFAGLLISACAAQEGGEKGQVESSTPDRKNVVFILVDDLGYADIGAYNPDTFYETPNVDALAQSGVMFTNGYAANPVCSPSRAAIMTGKHPTRLQATDWFHADGVPHRAERFQAALMKEEVASEEVTIGEVFQENGYQTAYLGKWHLGEDETVWPEHQGFDVNIGGFSKGHPAAGYFSPYKNPRLEDGPEGEYLTTRLTDEAVSLIDTFSKNQDPFFMYMAFYTVHTPLQAPADLIRKYENKWVEDGKADFADEIQYFADTEEVRKVRIRQNHAKYAAMVEVMDTSVGRILQALDDAGVADDTIIVFTSDNGGLSTAEGLPTSNLPLRGGKGWLYEGGIRVPFIVKFPDAANASTRVDMPVSGQDFLPSLAAMNGLQSVAVSMSDGLDFSVLLKEENYNVAEPRPLFWHYPHYSNQGGFPGAAVRLGNMKLLQNFETGEVQLYNLEEDVGETNDIASENPDTVRQLKQLLLEWYQETDAHFLRAKEGSEERPWEPNITQP